MRNYCQENDYPIEEVVLRSSFGQVETWAETTVPILVGAVTTGLVLALRI